MCLKIFLNLKTLTINLYKCMCHSRLCRCGVLFKQDFVHSGFCSFRIVPFGIFSILDCVHSGFCFLGLCPLHIVLYWKASFRILSIRAFVCLPTCIGQVRVVQFNLMRCNLGANILIQYFCRKYI